MSSTVASSNPVTKVLPPCKRTPSRTSSFVCTSCHIIGPSDTIGSVRTLETVIVGIRSHDTVHSRLARRFPLHISYSQPSGSLSQGASAATTTFTRRCTLRSWPRHTLTPSSRLSRGATVRKILPLTVRTVCISIRILVAKGQYLRG